MQTTEGKFRAHHNLAVQRRKLQITQQRIVELLAIKGYSMNRRDYSKRELGSTLFTLSIALEISRILNTPVNELFVDPERRGTHVEN